MDNNNPVEVSEGVLLNHMDPLAKVNVQQNMNEYEYINIFHSDIFEFQAVQAHNNNSEDKIVLAVAHHNPMGHLAKVLEEKSHMNCRSL